tara:strand:- start:81 stop:467 length:387 start_codon:yes stop_codon:yes gene_type:complete
MTFNRENMLHPYYTTVFVDTVRSMMDAPPDTFGHSGSWDTIEFPEGYDKPDKDLFDETFTRKFREKGFEILRKQRNTLLAQSDWTVTAVDVNLSESTLEAWKVYRQALRDLPNNTEDPENPTWPTPPQ